jgi:hypothetical protein
MPPLPAILQRAYSDIVHVVDNLRRSRGILEQAAVDRVHRTNAKLREVTSTTEIATTGMLDNLERGLVLLDDMDEAGHADEHAETRRNELRELLLAMLAQLQFQDITSQQLHYATSLLDDLEVRMCSLVELIDATVFGGSAPRDHTPHSLADVQGQHFDPAATTDDASARQQLADQIFS